ncbi:MAG: flagella accessory protein C [Nanobdellota archaeon]
MKIGNLKKKEEYSGNPEYISKKAEMIVGKITKNIKSPNPLLIDELKKLPLSASTSGDNVKEYLKQAKVYLSELLKDTKKVDSSLIEKYLDFIVEVSSKNVEKKADDKQVKKEPEKKEEVQNKKTEKGTKEPDIAKKDENVNDKNKKSVEKEKPVQENIEKEQPAKQQEQDVTKTKSGEAMMGLIMDEVKELVDSSSKISSEVKEKQEKFEKELTTLRNENDENKNQIEEIKKQIEKIQSNIEKFIGLYEVVSKMYNPFLEKEEDDQKGMIKGNDEVKSKKKTSDDKKGNFFEKEMDKQKEDNKKKIDKE